MIPWGHWTPAKERTRFMFLVTLLDHIYWVSGSLIGALAGTLLPITINGIGYALTALFITLMIEQIFRVRNPGIFISSAAFAVLCVFLLPDRISLLAAMALSLAVSAFLPKKENLPIPRKSGGAEL